MRFQFVSLFLLSCGIPATASTIQDFVIVNSSSLSPSGGVFTSGGGAFWGTFEVDTSKIPLGGTSTAFSLTGFDFFISSTVNQDLNLIEFSSGPGSAGTFIVEAEETVPDLGIVPVQVDGLSFTKSIGNGAVQVQLLMVEPVGRFRGGVVFDATAFDMTNIGNPITISDNFGTGMVLDPAVLAPEPGCGLLLASGLGLLVAARRWRGLLTKCS